jgi:hypothetical protein
MRFRWGSRIPGLTSLRKRIASIEVVAGLLDFLGGAYSAEVQKRVFEVANNDIIQRTVDLLKERLAAMRRSQGHTVSGE